MTECIEWWGYIAHTGYGWAGDRARRSRVPAHRRIYEECFGWIPDGYQVHHTCSNRACVNPAHLEVLTPFEHGRRHRDARETCGNGHAWTPENTGIVLSRGTRYCKACSRDSQQRLRDRRKAAA